MSWSITIRDLLMEEGIGNRELGLKPRDAYYDDEGTAHDEIVCEDAPNLPNDPSRNTNQRSPAYIAWAHFCRSVGLWDFFFHPSTGLMRHPCLHPFDDSHLQTVRRALSEYREAHAEAIPGFLPGPPLPGDPPRQKDPNELLYDGCLGRLVWLEWWMAYALKNFKHPGIVAT